ncbi:putative LPS assembly protein LptD, partial [Campylobacter jejuni]
RTNLIRDWRNGVSHSIPVSASFDLFNYFKVTPSVSYNERWYSSRVTRAYDPEKNDIIPVDTTYGFNRVY